MKNTSQLTKWLAPSVVMTAVLSAPLLAGTALCAEQATRLIGTISSGKFIGAVIDDPAGGQTFYRIHEKLPDGSELVKVGSDHVTVKRSDGMLYDLFIAHDTKSAPPSVASPAGERATSGPAAQERPAPSRRGGRSRGSPEE